MGPGKIGGAGGKTQQKTLEPKNAQDQFSKDGKVNWKATTMKQWLGSTALGRLFGGGQTLKAQHEESTLNFLVQHFKESGSLHEKFTDERIREALEHILHEKSGKKLEYKITHLKDISRKDAEQIGGALIQELHRDPIGPTAKQIQSLVDSFEHMLIADGHTALTRDELTTLAKASIKDNPKIAEKLKLLGPDEKLSMRESESLLLTMGENVKAAPHRKSLVNYVIANLQKTNPGESFNKDALEKIINPLIQNNSDLLSRIQSGQEPTPPQKRFILEGVLNAIEASTILSSEAFDTQHFVISKKIELTQYVKKNVRSQFTPNFISDEALSRLISKIVDQDTEILSALQSKQPLTHLQKRKILEETLKYLEAN